MKIQRPNQTGGGGAHIWHVGLPAASRLAGLPVRARLPLAVAVDVLPRLILLLAPHLQQEQHRRRRR